MCRFLQVHTLTHYPASLLNRDDAGFAKRMPFGGVMRTRISSQCLKRHWRTYDGEHSLKSIAAPESIRSRIGFERYVVEPLVRDGIAIEAARRATQRLIGKVFGGEAKRERAEKKAGKKKVATEGAASPSSPPTLPATTPQVTILGQPELQYFRQIVLEAVQAAGGDPEKVEGALDARVDERELTENLKALKPGSLEAGLGAALFGRMVTGDILARTDAAIHVAHALTVHGQMTETDYFTAIDDLLREDGEHGSGHINVSELTSGLFYGYVVVDVKGLVGNVGDDQALAGEVVERLVHMLATVSPGAKKGSTAPYAYSHLVLIESGNAQPRTLQNAFIEPVRTTGNLVTNAYDAMKLHLADLDGMYGQSEQRAHAGLQTGERFEEKKTLRDLASWAKAQVIA